MKTKIIIIIIQVPKAKKKINLGNNLRYFIGIKNIVKQKKL